ncbi:hypothetical protein HBI52_197320 [Parastagonospora nodorum]|nr:hypothetical protein HBI52_197320 [Parastagonospora nodorum]
MCAKDDLVRRKGPLLISTQTSNYVDTFSLDFAFLFTAWLQRIKCTLGNNILLLIAFIISYRLFADKLRLTPSTLLARFIPITKIRDLLLKTNYEEQVLLTSVKKNRYYMRCTKHYNFNIYVSLAIDILHLLLKGLVMHSTSLKRFNNKKAFIELIAVVSLLFVLKAPFALHFIYAVYDLVTLAQYKSHDEDILAYIQGFYSITNKKEYILQICFEVAANIVISNFTHAAARSSSKRHNDSKYCNKEVLYLILIIIDYTCYDKDRKYIAYIRAFSKFYDLSTIIYLVHLVLRDLPNSTTYTTMSYYVNNYIN